MAILDRIAKCRALARFAVWLALGVAVGCHAPERSLDTSRLVGERPRYHPNAVAVGMNPNSGPRPRLVAEGSLAAIRSPYHQQILPPDFNPPSTPFDPELLPVQALSEEQVAPTSDKRLVLIPPPRFDDTEQPLASSDSSPTRELLGHPSELIEAPEPEFGPKAWLELPVPSKPPIIEASPFQSKNSDAVRWVGTVIWK